MLGVDEMETRGHARPFSRREALRVGTFVAGITWVAPVVKPIALTAGAAEATSSVPKGGASAPPEATGSPAGPGSGDLQARVDWSGNVARRAGNEVPVDAQGESNPLRAERTTAENSRSASVGGTTGASGGGASGPRPGSGAATAKEARVDLTG